MNAIDKPFAELSLAVGVIVGQSLPHERLDRPVAFCCAVEPSALMVGLPPQFSPLAEVPPVAPSVSEEDPALLSLPQAVRVNAAIAAADKTLPMLLSFTYSTFR